MRISHLANDKVLRATVWHEMAHWLWDAADKHPKLAKWRADLEEHFAQRTANDELQTHKDGWKFLRDKWISDYAGRADYEGRKPGVEVPSVYLSYLSDGPVGGAMWDHDPHAVETFKLVMSILGPP